MTRDELEAVIWAHWTRPHAPSAVDAILDAADRYATAQAAATLGAIDNYRRNEPLPVHYLAGAKLACTSANIDVVNTTDRGRVTCGRCKNTRAWKDTA